MGLIETVEEYEDILKNKRKILFDRGERLEKNFEPVIGKEIGQDRDDEVVGGKDRVQVQESDAWRGVHHNQLVLLLHRTEKPLQSELSRIHRKEREFYR